MMPDYFIHLLLLQVDWNSFIGAVEKIGNREARVCTFAIRMMFHNSGATAKDGPPNKSRWQGADASVMSNYEEVRQSVAHLLAN